MPLQLLETSCKQLNGVLIHNFPLGRGVQGNFCVLNFWEGSNDQVDGRGDFIWVQECCSFGLQTNSVNSIEVLLSKALKESDGLYRNAIIHAAPCLEKGALLPVVCVCSQAHTGNYSVSSMFPCML
jgi:hypothetical protein